MRVEMINGLRKVRAREGGKIRTGENHPSMPKSKRLLHRAGHARSQVIALLWQEPSAVPAFQHFEKRMRNVGSAGYVKRSSGQSFGPLDCVQDEGAMESRRLIRAQGRREACFDGAGDRRLGEDNNGGICYLVSGYHGFNRAGATPTKNRKRSPHISTMVRIVPWRGPRPLHSRNQRPPRAMRP